MLIYGLAKEKKNLIWCFNLGTLGLWKDNGDQRNNVRQIEKNLNKVAKRIEGVGWIALYIENHEFSPYCSTRGHSKLLERKVLTSLGMMYL